MFSLSLQKTFESVILTSLYPKSAISIFVEVLQADGGNFSYVYKRHQLFILFMNL